MTNLEILHAGGNCGIGDEGIDKFNWIKCIRQQKITNVNYMTNLKIFYLLRMN